MKRKTLPPKRTAKNKYYDAFVSEVSWFNYDNSQPDFFEPDKKPLPLEFKTTFPITSELYGKCRLTGVRLNEKTFTLLTWELADSSLCGWMCQKTGPNSHIVPDHALLNHHIGGILESFNGPSNIEVNDIRYNVPLSLNQNFMFLSEKCGPLPKSSVEAYHQKCKEHDCHPIDMSPMIYFAVEANGNMSFYDKFSNEVLLLAHDHFFDFVTPIAGQPEYTLHSIDGASTFTEFVELLSSQWLKHIEQH